MGDGFVIAQSNSVDFYYYYDEPGLVPVEPEVLQMASGDTFIQVSDISMQVVDISMQVVDISMQVAEIG